MIDEFNAIDRKAMLVVAEVHKPGVPPHENEEYVAKVKEMLDPWQQELGQRLAAIRAGAEPAAEPDEV